MANTVLFFFGSRVTNAPGVDAITDAVMTAQMQFGGGVFSRGLNHPDPRRADYGRLVRDLLKRVRAQIVACNRPRPTYEDIAAVVADLDKQSDTLRSPGLQPFYERLEAEMTPLIEACRNGDDELSFGSLVIQATRWIQTVVHDQLTEFTQDPVALKAFLGRFLLPAPSAVIATTNHDWFVEDTLTGFGRTQNVGFVHDRKSGVERFRPHCLRRGHGTLLLKLHGSVDWFSHKGGIVRSRPKTNPDHSLYGRAPVVLAGTINKLEDYNYLLFPHLMTAFQNTLYRTKRVLVNGYGFLDTGINGRLIDWWESDKHHCLGIIHPDPAKLRVRAHWHAQQTLLREAAPRVTIWPERFENATSPSIATKIKAFLSGQSIDE